MADKYKTIKISDFPDGTLTPGLLVPAVDANNNSVKVTLEQLQGNKGADGHSPVVTVGANGNWLIDGVDSGNPSKGADGEVTLVQLATKADKVNSETQAAAYFKPAVDSNDGSSGATDLTTAFRATETGAANGYLFSGYNSWYFNGIGSTLTGVGVFIQKTTSTNTNRFLMMKLKPATTYELRNVKTGYQDLFPPIVDYDPESAAMDFTKRSIPDAPAPANNLWVYDNTAPYQNVTQRHMASVLLFASAASGTEPVTGTTAYPSYVAYPEWGNPFKFTTPNVELWLVVPVFCSDANFFTNSGAILTTKMDWFRFDIRNEIELYEYAGSSTTGSAAALTDVSGNELQSFDFENVVSDTVTKIKGISSSSGGGSSTTLKNRFVTDLRPQYPTSSDLPIVPNVILEATGGLPTAAPTTGGNNLGYLDFYFEVDGDGGLFYIPSFTNYTTMTDGNTLIPFIMYDENKKEIPWGDKTLGVPMAPPAVVFTQTNIPNSYYARVQTGLIPRGLGCKFVRFNIANVSSFKTTYDQDLPEKRDYRFWKIYQDPDSDSGEETGLEVSIKGGDLKDVGVFPDSDTLYTLPNLRVSSDQIYDGETPIAKYDINMRGLNSFVGSFNTCLDQVYASKEKALHCFVGHFVNYPEIEALIATQRAVCKNRNIPFIDLAAISGLTNFAKNVNSDGTSVNNLMNWTSDGLHPGMDDGSQALANLLTQLLTGQLRSIYGDMTGMRVKLVGDSITVGATYNDWGGVAWAQFLRRACVALGATVTISGGSGMTLRATNLDGIDTGNTMTGGDPSIFKSEVIGSLSTIDLIIWQIGVNDFTNDKRDFQLNW